MLLYHSFSRAAAKSRHLYSNNGNKTSIIESGALDILEKILNSGILLTPEHIHIPWDDPYGSGKASELDIVQHRFCLTALNNNEQILHHSDTFGPITIGFPADIVRKLGGFPVFYLPSPTIESDKGIEYFDKIGISLLYRLAEIRAILETINQLPDNFKSKLIAHTSDFDNTLGAIRFIGNILYLTDNLKKDTDELRYYRQQEWRIIAGLSSEDIKMSVTGYNGSVAYIISALGKRSISEFIHEITVVGTSDDKKHIENLLARKKMYPIIRQIEPAYP